MNLGFIGVGNMGFAMLKGGLKVFGDSINYTDLNQERLAYVKEETGLDYTLSNQEVVNQSDIIVLAVKPQYMAEVLMPLHIDLPKIIISIAPGLSIDFVNAHVSGSPKIVRAMPNTPALVGAGMSAVAFGPMDFTEKEKETVMTLFNSFGKTLLVPEKLIDATVPVSGSSPAYVYMIIEAMADGAVLNGISRQDAYQLAAQTVFGAAKMVLDTGIHPGQLKDAVCSPGGTTIEAVKVLEERGLRSSIIEAMDACYHKSQQMK